MGQHFEGGTGTATARQGTNPAADYSEGASHVLDVIHRILNHHRALEQKWHVKKIKLHQRLALRLFQEDVKQVRLAGLGVQMEPSRSCGVDTACALRFAFRCWTGWPTTGRCSCGRTSASAVICRKPACTRRVTSTSRTWRR